MSSPRNTSQCGIVFAFLLLGFVLSPAASSQTYTQYTPSSIGPMTSETEATIPANRTRTAIGIGERVVCRIDSSTWADQDLCNGISIVDDTIGDRIWLCTPGGTVSPSGVTVSDSTTLTAGMSPNPSVTVAVYVDDSGTKYLDDSVERLKSFQVLAPNNMSVSWLRDDGLGRPSGSNYIGAKTTYRLRVMPTMFSFYRVLFREHVEAETYQPWPCGATNERKAADPEFNVLQDNYRAGDDPIFDGPLPSWYLWDGQQYRPYSYATVWVNQYRNAASNWINVKNMNTMTRFSSSLTCQEEYNSIVGSWQGPWQ